MRWYDALDGRFTLNFGLSKKVEKLRHQGIIMVLWDHHQTWVYLGKAVIALDRVRARERARRKSALKLYE